LSAFIRRGTFTHPTLAYTILAGGYTSFIASYKFTPSTGTLKYISQSNSNQNPSWIAQHPTLKNVLYATNENYNGAVESFTINSDGSVTSVATQNSGGADPAHLLPLSTGQVAIMNVRYLGSIQLHRILTLATV
jgi:6-phosphogluconolactonase (cycloisomerase 2 family)